MLCKRTNVSSRTRMALQPGSRVLRSFMEAGDARDAGASKPGIAVTPNGYLRTLLEFDLHATIRRPPFCGVVRGDVAAGALEAHTNEGLLGKLLLVEIVTHGQGAVLGEHVVKRSTTQSVRAATDFDRLGGPCLGRNCCERLTRGRGEHCRAGRKGNRHGLGARLDSWFARFGLDQRRCGH